MTLHSWIRRLFSRTPRTLFGTSDLGAAAPATSRIGCIGCKKQQARRLALLLERLEDRLAPTVSVSLNTISTGSPPIQELDLTADPSVSGVIISVAAPLANQLQIVTLNDKMSLAGGLQAGDLDSTGTVLRINTSNEPVTVFNVYLPNGTDKLLFGLTNTTDNNSNSSDNSTGVNTVNIGANPNTNGTPPTPGTTPSTDTNDTVYLDTLNLGVYKSGALNVSAGTIDIQAANQVSAANISLTSVRSLTFATTGMPYRGSLRVNAAPPPGQPFADDEYLTGPDWGALGYAPNDLVEFANPYGANDTAFTVEGIVGANLYLNTSSAITTGSDPMPACNPISIQAMPVPSHPRSQPTI